MTYQINEDDPYANKPKSMQDLMGKFQIGREKTKHEYEYQEICEDLQKDFGKLVWIIPHKNKPWVTEFNLKEAGKIARKNGITTVPYLIGIMKKL